MPRNRAIPLVLLLASSQAAAYTLLGTDWTWEPFPCEEPWFFNPTGFASSAGTATELEDAFSSAMMVWNDADANFAWIDGGPTAATSYAWDGDMVAQYYASISGSTLALTSVWGSGSEIGECDMYFFGKNDYGSISWSADPSGASGSEYDIERVAIHELGHCLGLDHSASGSAIMYPSTGPGTGASGRVLHSDDVDGALAIYGPSEPFLEWFETAVDDDASGASSGDGDGIAERGETIEIDIAVENSGTGEGAGITATITESAADLTVTDGSAPVDDTPEGGTAWTTSPFVVAIASSCVTDQRVSFDLDLVDGDGTSTSDRFRLDVSCRIDADGDGFDDATDCDDAVGDVFPGAAELCDGVDQDCDGAIDDGASDALTWYADADGDGHGDPATAEVACDGPPGAISDATDCDDTDASVYPGAPGLDADCEPLPSDTDTGLDTDPDVDTDPPVDTDPDDTDPADTDPVVDTDPADTDVIVDTDVPEDEEPKTCGCASGQGGAGWLGLAVAAILARRRVYAASPDAGG